MMYDIERFEVEDELISSLRFLKHSAVKFDNIDKLWRFLDFLERRKLEASFEDAEEKINEK